MSEDTENAGKCKIRAVSFGTRHPAAVDECAGTVTTEKQMNVCVLRSGENAISKDVK